MYYDVFLIVLCVDFCSINKLHHIVVHEARITTIWMILATVVSHLSELGACK